MQTRMVQGKRRLLHSRDWMSMALGERNTDSPCMTTEQPRTALVLQDLMVTSQAQQAHVCACSAFYERMKEVREYHRRYPYLEVAEVSSALSPSGLWHLHHGIMPVIFALGDELHTRRGMETCGVEEGTIVLLLLHEELYSLW